jgi:hypothetical protein
VSVCADHTEDPLGQDARRAQEIATGEETAAQAAADDEQALSPDAEIAQTQQHRTADPPHRHRRLPAPPPHRPDPRAAPLGQRSSPS